MEIEELSSTEIFDLNQVEYKDMQNIANERTRNGKPSAASPDLNKFYVPKGQFSNQNRTPFSQNSQGDNSDDMIGNSSKISKIQLPDTEKPSNMGSQDKFFINYNEEGDTGYDDGEELEYTDTERVYNRQ